MLAVGTAGVLLLVCCLHMSHMKPKLEHHFGSMLCLYKPQGHAVEDAPAFIYGCCCSVLAVVYAGLGAVTLAAHTVVKNIVDYANNIFGTFSTVAQSLVASELGKVS